MDIDGNVGKVGILIVMYVHCVYDGNIGKFKLASHLAEHDNYAIDWQEQMSRITDVSIIGILLSSLVIIMVMEV